MTTTSAPAEQRVILDCISWETYVAILNDAVNRRGRIAYDRGVLEIMSPSRLHEKYKVLIGRMIEAFTEEYGIDVESVASTTFKREDLERGFEADEAYYVQHAAEVREHEEVDLYLYPGPDLVVEVDISRSSLRKVNIYKSLQVGEVWRYNGEVIEILVRTDSEYAIAHQSQALPGFPLAEALETLGKISTVSETQLIRDFRAFVRAEMERGGET